MGFIDKFKGSALKAGGIKVHGVAELRVALMARSKHYANGIERGLKKGGLHLQRASQLLCPIDTGALRNSAFTRATGIGFHTVVRVGYTMEYAIYVHENLMAKHPVGQAKYLEQPARTERPAIIRIVIFEAGWK